MKVTKIIHQIWQSWDSMPQELKNKLSIKRCILGKYQYIYTQDKIRISLIRLNSIMPKNIRFPFERDHRWEICGGGLTDDVETFPTKKKAEKRIKELLGKQK